MLREQKTVKAGCPCEDRVELEGSKGAQSILAWENDSRNGTDDLLIKLLDRDNLNQAYKRVKQNGGAGGIDGMTVDEMLPYLKEHKEELLERIRSGKYKPQPVRRVEIPKRDGGVRKLGIPTVIDRMIQQAMVQILQPIFEPTFSDNSYGYRPGRSAQQAMKKAKEYYEQGYTRVVDLDLSKYFDTLNHELLMDMVRKQIKDRALLDLIKKYLKSGVMVNGVKSKTESGSPQGGPLSPLLSNIYLTALDKEMEKRGHKSIRYADDIGIYVKSSRAAERVMKSSIEFLENKLKLQVNREKSKAGSPLRLKFLGFCLYKAGKKTGIRPHAKSLATFKKKAKAITGRSRGKKIEETLKELKRFTSGWLNYYSIAEMHKRMKSLSEWLRRRIRMCIWKQWKKISAKFRNLQKLGIAKQKAWEWANTRLGYWRVAGSPVLSRSLTNKYLESIGYDDISKRYEVLYLSY